MLDYQKGKIYKIVNDEMPNMVYYGSTCNTLTKRLNAHKNISSTCKSAKELFEYGKPQMILVEKYACNDIDELRQRERFYIENNECVNLKIPGRTASEASSAYREKNRTDLRLKNNIQYAKNKETINKKFDCDCGGKYTYQHKARHEKTKKHLKYIN